MINRVSGAGNTESMLVLQFDSEGLDAYDKMIALEGELEVSLADTATVDGHDMGSGEMNIFIVTADPVGVFEEAKAVVEKRGMLAGLRAAFRPADGSNYTILWPLGATGFSVK